MYLFERFRSVAFINVERILEMYLIINLIVKLLVWSFLIIFSIGFQLANAQQTTSPAQVKKDFAANWTEGGFPRLYTGATELQRFKDLVEAGDEIAVKTWREIRLDAEELLGMGIPDWRQDSRGVITPIHDLQQYYVPPLAVAYLMTGDSRFADKLWAIAQKMMSYTHWGANTATYVNYHFLDAGIAGLSIAQIYDAIHNYLTPAKRLELYGGTKKLLFAPALATYNGGGGQNGTWPNATTNWNAICNGGIVAACLTMFENDPDYLSDIAARAINNFKPHLESFNPEGSGKEGYGYWLYGTKSLVTAFDIMKRTLGTTYGNADTYAMRHTGYFPVYFSGPVATLNLGNDYPRTSRENSLLWFAKYHNDNSLAKLYYDICYNRNKMMPWYDMFNYDPDQVNQGISLTLPLDKVVSGMNVHSFYEKWNDPNALYIAIHGGGEIGKLITNGSPHGHLDAGTFFIQGLGEIWAIGNLGPENYSYPNVLQKSSDPDYNDANTIPSTIGGWHYYRNRAESKNCLIFNPDYRPEQDWWGRAKTTYFQSETNQGTVTIDMQGIYSRDVNTYQRACRLNRLHRVITIQDTYSAKENKRIWWNMNTTASVSISSDGRSALLTRNGKQLKALIRFPHEAQFQVLPATYLDGRTFPLTTNGSNGGYKKLGICLPSSKEGIIRVDFLPLDAENDSEAIIDDFEGFSYAYTSSSTQGNVVSMVDNPDVSMLNQSDLVLKFSVNGSVQSIPSLRSLTRSFVVGTDLGQYNLLKMKIRADVAADFRLQLTNSKDNFSAEFAADNSINQTNTWQELTFDLRKNVNGVSASGKTFDGVRLIPFYEVTNNEVSFYLDDLMLMNEPITGNIPELVTSNIEIFRQSDGIQLSSFDDIIQVDVFSIAGVRQISIHPNSNSCFINLDPGKIYLLRIRTTNALVVRKVFF
jgi:hypothetical protein